MIVDNNIIKTEFKYQPPTEGLGEVLFKSMKHFKNNVAQYVADTGEVDTFENLLQRSIRCALNLKSKGYNENDIISICSHNHLNTCVPEIAALFTGIKVAPIDPTYHIKDIAHLLNQVPIKVAFVAEDAVETIEKSIELANLKHDIKIVVFGETKKHEKFDEYLVSHEEENNFTPRKLKSLKDTSIIVFSSGSTGLPKGICIRDQALTYHSYNSSIFTGIDPIIQQQYVNNDGPSRVALFYSNISWISYQIVFASSIINGNARLVVKEFNPKMFWYLLEKYKVYTVFLTPNQIMDVLPHDDVLPPVNLSNLYTFFSGGATVPASLIKKLKRLLPHVLVGQGFGQTEAAGVILAFDTEDENDRNYIEKKYDGSVGRVLPGLWVKIVDEETGKPLGPNKTGEMCIKTEFRMNGYYNLDSTDAFDKEGYIRSGDIVYYDENYYFYIVDRIKEMIKWRSKPIAPASIEAIIHEHPAVKKAIVIGLPHEEDGERPLAVIQLKDPNQKVDPEEIRKFVNERVDDKKQLRGGVRFIKTEFPLTSTSKINRRALKKLVVEGVI